MLDLIHKDWQSFCIKAWKSVNAPEELHPSNITTEPISYDKNCYLWLEKKYNPFFKKAIQYVEKELTKNSRLPRYYLDYWKQEFNDETIWKQLIPFCIFSKILNVEEDTQIQFAKFFIIGQAIPSVTINKLLDKKAKVSPNGAMNKSLFSILSILNSINGIKDVLDEKTFNKYLDYISLMYELMFQEYNQRFILPERVDKAYINDYLYGESRLISTVYYSITIEASYSLAKKDIPVSLNNALVSLRRVRELLDELLDLNEDIREGLSTLPIIYCLGDPLRKKDITELLSAAWKTKADKNVENVIDYLIESNAVHKCAAHSFTLLEQVFEAVMENFSPKEIFDFTLLINIRLAIISRQRLNGWKAIDKELLYFPSID